MEMKKNLAWSEMVVTDNGYQDYSCLTKDKILDDDSVLHRRIRARHETVNSSIENFGVLERRFRHDISLHSFCFHAVINIQQLLLENGDPLFDV